MRTLRQLSFNGRLCHMPSRVPGRYLGKYVAAIDGFLDGCSDGSWILRQADSSKDYIKPDSGEADSAVGAGVDLAGISGSYWLGMRRIEIMARRFQS